MDRYKLENKAAWEEAFERRDAAWCADLERRLAEDGLPFVEPPAGVALRALGARGKTVGHFCCNNGRELMSLMRLGYGRGFGFDLAENMVAFANAAAERLGLACEFVACDAAALAPRFASSLDIAYISIGALCWFEDLGPLFSSVAEAMKPEAALVISEVHPFANMLAAPGEPGYDPERPASFVNSYFSKMWLEDGGMPYMTGGSYASKTFTSFSHPLSSVLNAAAEAGLRLRRFDEFDYDISSGMFAALDGKGAPLSYLLVADKG